MDAADTPVVRLEEVDVAYVERGARTEAVTNISFEVMSGEFVCIVGPSGCGKSTILNLIGGFIRPTRGRVLAQGREVVGSGPDRGVIFQEFVLFPWMTVAENIGFGPTLQKWPPAETKRLVNDYMDLMGLSQFRDSYPASLSGGMKQRVAIARSLVCKPEILLMDEPFGSLDAQTRAEMQEMVSRIVAREKVSVVFVTHDVGEAVLLGDRVLVMSKRPGTITACSTIGLPRPRQSTSIGTPGFEALRREVEGLLRKERLPSPGAERPMPA